MAKTFHAAQAIRKPANVTLSVELVAEAKRLGINLSRACEQGLTAQISKERADRWRKENMESIQSSNSFVEQNGLPLAGLRQF